jgi:Nuclease-related domain
MAGESAWDSARRQREKAERLLRSAELHEQGAIGEEATAMELSVLTAKGWTVFHDVRWPGRSFANVDHVVIGAPGIFVIDSKNWNGRIAIRDGVLRQNGYRREPAVAGATEAALAVAQLTDVVAPNRVLPVLCFVRDEPLSGWARDVIVCSSSNLVQMLESRPNVLTAAQVRDASLQLDALLSPRATGTRPARSRSHAPRRVTSVSRSRPSKTRRRRRENDVARLVVGLALIGLLIFAPEVVTGFGQLVAAFIMNAATSSG